MSAWLKQLLIWVGITAVGGILLWVNGVMGPIRYRTMTHIPGLPSFTVFFLLWLLLYGLCGLILGMSFLTCVNTCDRGRGQGRLGNGVWCSLMAYLFLLAWYPLFFSMFHGFLSALVLLAAVGCHVVVLWRLGRHLLLAFPLACFTIIGEIYFLYVTISSNLLI